MGTFKIRRGGHVVLVVTDVPTNVGLLDDLIGFKTVAILGIHCMTANAVANHHMIALSKARKNPDGRLPQADQIGMVTVSYEVSNFEELRQLYVKLRDHAPDYGAKVLHSEDRGTINAFQIADLDGNHLEFFCRVPDALGAPWVLRGSLDEQLNADVDDVPLEHCGLRTGHVTLRCRDVVLSKRFFEDELHLFPVGDDGAGRTYYSGDPDTNIVVVALEQARNLEAPVPTPNEMYGMSHFAFELSSFRDLQVAWKDFADHGVNVSHNFDHGVTQSVYFQDPDGNMLEVYHDVPRAEYKDPADPFAAYGAFEDRLAMA
jgi:catechol 2,3-dioxygenase